MSAGFCVSNSAVDWSDFSCRDLKRDKMAIAEKFRTYTEHSGGTEKGMAVMEGDITVMGLKKWFIPMPLPLLETS